VQVDCLLALMESAINLVSRQEWALILSRNGQVDKNNDKNLLRPEGCAAGNSTACAGS
jgi:hypothetical protein